MSVTVQLNNANLVLAGHGSRDPDGAAEFERFAEDFKKRLPDTRITHGYLEFQQPSISESVLALAENTEGPIVVVPALLAAATHAKNDMPSLLRELRAQLPERDIRFAAVMDLHASLLRLCQLRIAEAEATSSQTVSRADTCLVVVGRGTSDPDANGEIAKLSRLLQEGMKFGSSITCYSGTAQPLVADGLKAAALLAHKRVIVMPYFLFDGVLVKRIYAAAEEIQRRHPELEVLSSVYVGNVESKAVDAQQVLSEVFAERAHEALHGTPTMNCGLCKYRTPIVGYEDEVALPQLPHAELFRVQLAQTAAKPSSYSSPNTNAITGPYVPHPIEAESFEIIERSHDWQSVPEEVRSVLMRVVHTTGDFACIDDMFFSPGVVQSGVASLLRCRQIVTDVTMVQSGLKRELLEKLQVSVSCYVHDAETRALSEAQGITRSAAGIRLAWQKHGNDVVLSIGDAPTAVAETVRLINEHCWRPQLVVGIPVGFVGTRECKESLRNCVHVPRITNSGTRGGSPWAATVINALLIKALNQVADRLVARA